jgi:hypothetical protein
LLPQRLSGKPQQTERNKPSETLKHPLAGSRKGHYIREENMRRNITSAVSLLCVIAE